MDPMTQTQIDPDGVLKKRVVDELTWTPGVDATHIGVGVTDGAVTLSGEVESYPEKRLAEKAVRRVKDVRAIAEEITVRTVFGLANDTDIARAAGVALSQAVDIAADAVTATVSNHVVILEGTVPWRYQRESAERTIRYLKGVRDVQNNVRVKVAVSTSNIKNGIEAALVRQAVIDAKRCIVTTDHEGAVTITGTVGTWAERAQVDRVAWAAAGVTAVHNQVTVVD